ncbi:hypothetical protein QA596_08585 [Balneolales bacterium ANBcel1]|nr:hypothetical protein [Balneolales bacterium ANBcel1]
MPSSQNTQPALPEAFTARIRRQIPEHHDAFLDALETAPAVSIRLNPHKPVPVTNPAGSGASPRDRVISPVFSLTSGPVPWSRNGRYLRERPSFTGDPVFHAGGYYVQEASSMFLEHVLNLPAIRQKSDLILDACAAPGGKTTLIAAQFPRSLVVANEVIRSRIPALLENSIKWGTGNLVITRNESRHFTRLNSYFDLVVADVPCSGEGLFRKTPSARSEWSVDNAAHCSLRQRSILTELWEAVAPGGHLVYTTCTFNPDENERNIAWLLNKTGGECVSVPLTFPGDSSGAADSIHEISDGPVTGYGFYPHRTSGEGFFLSLIRKPATGTSAHARRPRAHAPAILDASDHAAAEATTWFEDDDLAWFQISDRLHHIRSSHMEHLHMLASSLSVVYAGTEAGKIIRDAVRPSPAAALDIRMAAHRLPQFRCGLEEAQAFLRRETLPVSGDTATGWQLATYHGLPLGWLKNIGSRLNNYHPMEWRIRR